ncbi:MAG: PPOX class F420-dependent oxidoreductase [Thermomicrobiales bacterium]
MAIDPKIRAFLEERRFAVLATINSDATIQQTVMWFQLQGDRIMMNTARGRVKDRNLLSNRNISICVEDDYRYVTIKGTAELNEDPEQGQADIKALATRYEGAEKAEQMVPEAFGKQHRVSIYLPLEKVDAHGFDGD